MVIENIAKHIGVNLSTVADDLNSSPFYERDRQIGANTAFGADLVNMLDELNMILTQEGIVK